jgi:hypothetical protein
LNGRPRPHFRTGPRTNCKRAHGAATLIHGPFQRLVRRQRASAITVLIQIRQLLIPLQP